MRRFSCVAASLSLGVGAAHAHAQESSGGGEAPTAVALHYSAAGACPDEARFVSEILARVRKPVRFVSLAVDTELVVKLSSSGPQQAEGTLQLVRAGAEPTRREFTGASCAEVGSALALVAALSLDPNARTEPGVRAESSEVGPVQASPVIAPPTSAPEPPPAPPKASNASARPPAPPLPAKPASGPAHAEAWLGPAAGIVVGAAPSALGLVGFGLGARSVTGRLVSPGLQLTPLWGKTGVTGPKSSQAEYAWALGRLEACPISLAIYPHARIDPCAAIDVGRLTAHGAEGQVPVPVAAERWWVAPGVTASLHVSFRSWFLRLGGMALFPATRDEFVFQQPLERVHQAAPVLLGANLGLGFEAWQ